LGVLQNGQMPGDLVPWLSDILNPERNNGSTRTDECNDYFLDYQFNKCWDSGAQITAGTTFRHTRHYSSAIDQVYKSDNLAVFFQYDQRFWDRLSVSSGFACRVELSACRL